MLGIACELGKGGYFKEQSANGSETLCDFTPVHLPKVLAGRGQHLDCSGQNNNSGRCGNGFPTEFCSVQEQRHLGQQDTDTGQALRQLPPFQVSQVSADRRQNLDCPGEYNHLRSAFDY